MTDTAIRTLEGRTLPVTGSWAIDPTHSSVEFVVRHLGLAKVRGRFAAFDGTITVADDPAESGVEVTIDAASIDTRSDDRDAHLRSPDFFAVEEFPTLTYRSTGVRPAGDDRWQVDGELTIRDVTRPVTLDAVFEGTAQDPWGNDRAVFSATTEIDREDFGLTWNQALETGGLLVGKRVRIEIDVEAVHQ